jgi:hypothetical protein
MDILSGRDGMEKFLIETPHTTANCLMLINQLHSQGYLHNFEWGCSDGVHCGWAIVEAESEEQARMIVPSLIRKDAKVVRIIKFDLDEAGELHAS